MRSVVGKCQGCSKTEVELFTLLSTKNASCTKSDSSSIYKMTYITTRDKRNVASSLRERLTILAQKQLTTLNDSSSCHVGVHPNNI
jgi:hypothetical protein